MCLVGTLALAACSSGGGSGAGLDADADDVSDAGVVTVDDAATLAGEDGPTPGRDGAVLDASQPDGAPNSDAIAVDVSTSFDTAVKADAEPRADAAMADAVTKADATPVTDDGGATPACGAIVPDVPTYGRPSQGLTIAPDGTLYYLWVPPGTGGTMWLARQRPGMAMESRFMMLAEMSVQKNAQGLTVDGDGTHLFAFVTGPAWTKFAIVKINVAEKTLVPIVQGLERGVIASSIAWSPDGYVYFASGDSTLTSFDVSRVPAAGGNVEKVSKTSFGKDVALARLPNGDLAYSSGGDIGVLALKDGKEMGRRTIAPVQPLSFDGVPAVITDSEGNIFFGSRGEGLRTVRADGTGLTTVKPDPDGLMVVVAGAVGRGLLSCSYLVAVNRNINVHMVK